MDVLFPLLVVGLLLVASAVVSGGETAFFSLSRAQQQRLKRVRGPVGASARALLQRPANLLMTLLLANLLVNLLYLSTATDWSLRLRESGSPWMGLAVSVGSVFALVLLAEVVPKTLARAHSAGLAHVLSLPLLVLERLLLPPVTVLRGLTDWLTRRFGAQPPAEGQHLTVFQRLIDVSHAKGVIAADQRRFLHELLEFSTLKVSDVMVPRVDVAAVDVAADREAVSDYLRTRRVSRLLAYSTNLDDIQGHVLAHEVLLQPDRPLSALVQPILAVPEVASAERVRNQMEAAGSPLAVVVDEYGGTAGIITLHDLVGEIVGEMADEHVHRERRILAQDENRYLVAGWTPLREWREETSTPEGDDSAATLGGLLVARLDRPPQRGDTVRTDWFDYDVLRVRGRRILLIEARRRQLAPSAEDEV